MTEREQAFLYYGLMIGLQTFGEPMSPARNAEIRKMLGDTAPQPAFAEINHEVQTCLNLFPWPAD
jgi:hypothetical protein